MADSESQFKEMLKKSGMKFSYLEPELPELGSVAMGNKDGKELQLPSDEWFYKIKADQLFAKDDKFKTFYYEDIFRKNTVVAGVEHCPLKTYISDLKASMLIKGGGVSYSGNNSHSMVAGSSDTDFTPIVGIGVILDNKHRNGNIDFLVTTPVGNKKTRNHGVAATAIYNF